MFNNLFTLKKYRVTDNMTGGKINYILHVHLYHRFYTEEGVTFKEAISYSIWKTVE